MYYQLNGVAKKGIVAAVFVLRVGFSSLPTEERGRQCAKLRLVQKPWHNALCRLALGSVNLRIVDFFLRTWKVYLRKLEVFLTPRRSLLTDERSLFTDAPILLTHVKSLLTDEGSLLTVGRCLFTVMKSLFKDGRSPFSPGWCLVGECPVLCVIEISNINGQVMQSGLLGTNPAVVDVENFSSGNYFMHLMYEGKESFLKFIKK